MSDGEASENSQLFADIQGFLRGDKVNPPGAGKATTEPTTDPDAAEAIQAAEALLLQKRTPVQTEQEKTAIPEEEVSSYITKFITTLKTITEAGDAVEDRYWDTGQRPRSTQELILFDHGDSRWGMMYDKGGRTAFGLYRKDLPGHSITEDREELAAGGQMEWEDVVSFTIDSTKRERTDVKYWGPKTADGKRTVLKNDPEILGKADLLLTRLQPPQGKPIQVPVG